jgi:hypothetical protein
MGDSTKGDSLKTRREGMQTERRGSATNNEAAHLASDPVLEQDAIAFLAYFCWEVRGCPHDSPDHNSPDEDWFRAEAERRNRLASTATD